MNYTATYSPDDNKLRLYASSRLDADLYARVKAAGFRWAPQQELFFAFWSTTAEDVALELAGEIDDEDKTLTDRAEERSDRFRGYSHNRERDANSAHAAVKAIADGIPLGQPILVGHHSEKHARRDAERIESGMRKAVKMWETAEYWKDRARGAIRHAKYKERPDVRARRIKTIEADRRKMERTLEKAAGALKLWGLIDQPEKWKPRPDGSVLTREERAAFVAGRVHMNVATLPDGRQFTAYDCLRLPAEERYKDTPTLTVDEIIAEAHRLHAQHAPRAARWLAHYDNRLAYERAMIEDAGGTATDRTKPEKGGGCKCWASPRGGWSYIQKVNRVSVTVLDNWGNKNADGTPTRNFTRTMPFDKLAGIMSAAQVKEARDAGKLKETPDGLGFYLMQGREDFDRDNPPKPEPEKPAQAEDFKAMKESLRAGVQVVSAPQLFPTPPELAARMVDEADIRPGMRILEPSAGTGAILSAIPGDTCRVAVEINHALANATRLHQLAEVRCADFLQCNGGLGLFDRVLMNPPFTKGEDIKHITHALKFLKPGGRLVAICANGSKQNEKLKPLVELYGGTWEELPAGTFEQSGTGVNTVLLTIDTEGA